MAMPRRCSIFPREDSGGVKGTPGIYVLIVFLEEARTIRVGRLGPQLFAPGFYLYVGSALGGLEARIGRHLAGDKRRHWHIDYLLDAGRVRGVLTLPTNERIECRVARALAGRFEGIAGFGASDCRCRSHLFYSPEGDGDFLRRQLVDIIEGEVSIGEHSVVVEVEDGRYLWGSRKDCRGVKAGALLLPVQ